MEHPEAFLFALLVSLSIYGWANYVVLKWGWRVLPDNVRVKRGYTVIGIFLASAYIVAELIEHADIGRLWINSVLVWAGSFWLGVFIYLFLAWLIIFVVRMLDRLLHFFPDAWNRDPLAIQRVTVGAAAGVVLIACTAGFINTFVIRTVQVNIEVDKTFSRPVRLAVVSDLHLGTVISESHLRRVLQAVEQCNPDAVLLAGDIVNEGMTPCGHAEIKELFRDLRPPLGLYACTGNHEFIVGVDRSVSFLESAGITVIRDNYIEVPRTMVLAARDDRSCSNFTGTDRKSLKQVLNGCDRELPLVLMDHTPSGLDNAVQHNVDLQVSGHTHYAQMWPLNLITGMMFEQDWGYLKKGDTHVYVSCGAGTWGPPIRIGSYPEVVVIDMVPAE